MVFAEVLPEATGQDQMTKNLPKLSHTVTVLALVATVAAAGDPPHFSEHPGDWIVFPIPIDAEIARKSDCDYTSADPGVAHVAANTSRHEWEVYIESNTPRVRRWTKNSSEDGDVPDFKIKAYNNVNDCTRRFMQVEDGWLIACDAGEFGANLAWASLDGKQQHKISDDQINQFIRFGGRILALEGLSHIGISRGQILEVYRDASRDRWQTKKVVGLPECPDVGVVHPDGRLYLVLTSSLARITPDNKLDVIDSDVFWRGLYPNSIVATKTGDLYIGMRGGVARVDIGSKGTRIRWLQPSREFAEKELSRAVKIMKDFCW